MDSTLFNITLDELPRFIEENPFAIVDFWNSDCSVCRILVPELEKFALENLGFCAFAKLQVDDVREQVTERFGIKGGPVFIAFMDGVEVDRAVGFYGVKTFRWMKKLIDAAC